MLKSEEFHTALLNRLDLETSENWAINIYNNKIFLGSGYHAKNYQKLIENKITNILNCTNDIENYYEDLNQFIYLKLNILDFNSFNTVLGSVSNEIGDLSSGGNTMRNIFYIAINFIKECLKNENGKVLIHCANGTNRSVTVAIAVLMVLQGDLFPSSSFSSFFSLYSFFNLKNHSFFVVI